MSRIIITVAIYDTETRANIFKDAAETIQQHLENTAEVTGMNQMMIKPGKKHQIVSRDGLEPKVGEIHVEFKHK